jgi:hypothetical protein
MLIGISTPYRKTGLLHQKWRDHFGADGDTLVVQGPTSLFNPSLSTDEIASQRAADQPPPAPNGMPNLELILQPIWTTP